MATPQLSPGILVREIDLTVGRVDNVINQIGGIAGPFQLGPVDEPIEVSNEAGFIETFGKPLSTDRQYEYWMSGSSYLSYGGVLKVVRTDGTTLRNANAGVGMANTTTLKVKNNDDYEENYQTATNFTWAAKNPGTWANGLKVAIIDNAADQRLGISTVAFGDGSNLKVNVGTAVTAAITGAIPGAGTTSAFDGYLKAIVTGVTTDSSGNDSSIDVKITARVSAAGTEYPINYAKNDSTRAFSASSDTLIFTNSSGITTGYSVSADTAVDWYDQQTLSLNTPIYWNSIAGRPVDSNFSSSRSGGGDSLHVVVVDDDGSVTGIQGNILEKHTFLSKAKDSTADGSAPTRNYYKDYLINGSQYIFAGYNPSIGEDAYHGTAPAATGFSTNFVPVHRW